MKKLFLCVGLLWFTSCQTFFVPVREPLPLTIPSTFLEKSDTSTIALQSWRDFFKDDYLENLIAIGLKNNRDLQIAIQRIEMAKASYLVAKGELLPALHLATSAGADKFGKYTMNGVGNFDTNLSNNITEDMRIPINPTPDFFVGFRSTWQIDIWGRIRNAKRASAARLMTSEAFKNLVITELVSQIGTVYYELLALDSELEVIEKNTILQQEVLQLIKIQKEAGKATELAVQQAEAQLLRTKSLEFILKNQIIALENQINALIGRSPQPILRTKNFINKPLLVVSSIGVPSQMLRLRPDIKAAELKIQAAQLDLRAAQAAFFPTLQLNTYAGYNAFDAGVLLNPASLAQGILTGLTAPIFQNNQLKAAKKIAQASAYEAYFEYQKTVLTALNEINTLMRTLENTEKIYQLRQEEFMTLQEAVRTAQDLFSTGYANYLEIITAQKGVLETEIDLFEIRKNQFILAIQIYKSLGGGWKE
ncbi:MAG: TolC family protein [Flammeovirgaceae bacterium]|nr:TolC family protein [Flammeovirgaceae bacterium]MDW8287162.1 TolC family protein [Flammeovirgaceae bacterium]